MKKYCVIDIGGSAIKYACIDEELNFYVKGKVPTDIEVKENLYSDIAAIVEKCGEVEGLAISMPGILDVENGIAHSGGVLKYIKDTPIVEELEARLHLPVTICNDGKAAAMAEIGFGNLQGISNGLVLVLGTGIAGGVVVNGKLILGKHYTAGEVSFIASNIDDPHNISNYFCMRNGITGLSKAVENTTGTPNLNGIEVFDLIKAGNKEALDGVKHFCNDLAYQIYNFNILLDLERVCIGGGISNEPMFIEIVKKQTEEFFKSTNMPKFEVPEIMTCKYDSDANLIGALYNFTQLKG